MSVTPSSMIVGVFRDQSAAEQAVNALYNSGFGHEQIQYMVPGTSGGFLEGLKSLFTGPNEGGQSLKDDLTGMGLSETDAEYYASEYNNGNSILIVRAAEHGTEALNVLHQYGAYNTQTGPAYAGEATGAAQQPVTHTEQGSSTADMPPSSDYAQQSGYGAPGQRDNVQNLETQPQAQTGEEHTYAGAQPENATPEYDLSDQDTRPVTPLNDTQAQDMRADTSTPAPTYATENQASETETATREQESETPPSPAPQHYGEYQDAPASGTASETDIYEESVEATPAMYETSPGYAPSSTSVPETAASDQAAQADTTTPEQEYASQVDQTGASAMNGYDSRSQQAMQPAPATTASPEQTDELQQLQDQLQSLQQQLQEAKARLQAAKEQEDQIKTAREREQQLQSTRQELKDVQTELQATLAEYQEIQSRIGQYQ